MVYSSDNIQDKSMLCPHKNSSLPYLCPSFMLLHFPPPTQPVAATMVYTIQARSMLCKSVVEWKLKGK